MAAPSRAKTYGLLAFIAVSTPLALAVETGMRLLIFPPEFDDIRWYLRPTLTPWIWTMAPLAAIATLVGFKLQRWLVRRELARLPEDKRTDDAKAEANFDALLLSTSAPQIPALIATFGFMFGSELDPVIAAMIVATAGVLVQGVALRR